MEKMLVKNLKPFGPNKEEDIQRVEKGEGVKFPADYREFLLTVGGGIFPQVRNPDAGPEDGVLYDLKPLGLTGISDGEKILDRYEILYGCLRSGDWKYDIESQLRMWDGDEEAYENPNKLIPIGLTKYGNTLMMELNDENYGRILYCDQQGLFDENDEDEIAIYVVGKSFTHFLSLLNDDSIKKYKGKDS